MGECHGGPRALSRRGAIPRYLAAMAIRPILIHPDPRLRKVAAPVEAIDDELRALADDMLATMYEAPGIGLAATQLGVMKRMFVMDCAGKDEPPQPMVLLNPEIVWRSEETETSEEGCLSIPDVYDEVTRAGAGAAALARARRRDPRAGVRRPLGDLRPARDRPSRRQAVHRLPERGEADDDHLADEEAEEGEGAGLSRAAFAMRLVFMGTPDFAVPALEALVAAGTRSPASTPGRRGPAGAGSSRGRARSRRGPRRWGCRCGRRRRCASPEAAAEFAALGAEAAVVAAYGLILPQPVLDAPARGCLNIHASLLPRWRGAAPIQRAIMAGDAETGVSIMAMEAGLDTGPVLLAEAVPIGPRRHRRHAARPAGGARARG